MWVPHSPHEKHRENISAIDLELELTNSHLGASGSSDLKKYVKGGKEDEWEIYSPCESVQTKIVLKEIESLLAVNVTEYEDGWNRMWLSLC